MTTTQPITSLTATIDTSVGSFEVVREAGGYSVRWDDGTGLRPVTLDEPLDVDSDLMTTAREEIARGTVRMPSLATATGPMDPAYASDIFGGEDAGEVKAVTAGDDLRWRQVCAALRQMVADAIA